MERRTGFSCAWIPLFSSKCANYRYSRHLNEIVTRLFSGEISGSGNVFRIHCNSKKELDKRTLIHYIALK